MLTPADIGREVQVRELEGGRNTDGEVIRASDPPRKWGVFAFFPLFLLGLGLLLRPAADVFRLARRLRAGRQ